MKVKHTQSVGIKIHCKTCHTNAMGVTGHVGKHHKACKSVRKGGRKVGLWIAGHFNTEEFAVATFKKIECPCGGSINMVHQ